MFLSPSFHPPKEGSSSLAVCVWIRLNEAGFLPPVVSRETEGGIVGIYLNLKAGASDKCLAKQL